MKFVTYNISGCNVCTGNMKSDAGSDEASDCKFSKCSCRMVAPSGAMQKYQTLCDCT